MNNKRIIGRASGFRENCFRTWGDLRGKTTLGSNMIHHPSMNATGHRPVIVRKPLEDKCLKSADPPLSDEEGGSSSWDRSSALWLEPTDSIRLATSPFCRGVNTWAHHHGPN